MAGALWNEAKEALSGIASLAGTYDTDGIDIYFLNSSTVGQNLRVRRLTINEAISDPRRMLQMSDGSSREFARRVCSPIVFRRH